MDEQETWKAIPGYVGYEVSTAGRVRSWRMKYGQRQKPLVLSLGIDHDGYHKVVLSTATGKVTRKVCALVAAAFIGPRPDGMVVAHDNGVAGDDRSTNLLYKTQRENIADKVRHGTMARGERIATCKLSQAEVIEIRSSSESSRQLAERFGVRAGNIWRIRTGKTWRSLAQPIAA